MSTYNDDDLNDPRPPNPANMSTVALATAVSLQDAGEGDNSPAGVAWADQARAELARRRA